MSFFNEFGKMDKNFFMQRLQYNKKKLETPKCLKMQISIMKNTHDINFIGI